MEPMSTLLHPNFCLPFLLRCLLKWNLTGFSSIISFSYIQKALLWGSCRAPGSDGTIEPLLHAFPARAPGSVPLLYHFLHYCTWKAGCCSLSWSLDLCVGGWLVLADGTQTEVILSANSKPCMFPLGPFVLLSLPRGGVVSSCQALEQAQVEEIGRRTELQQEDYSHQIAWNAADPSDCRHEK